MLIKHSGLFEKPARGALIKSFGVLRGPPVYPVVYAFLPTLNTVFLKLAALAVALAVPDCILGRDHRSTALLPGRRRLFTAYRSHTSDGFAIGMLGMSTSSEGRSTSPRTIPEGSSHLSDNQKATLFLARGLFVAGKYHGRRNRAQRTAPDSRPEPRRRESDASLPRQRANRLGNLDQAQQLLQQVSSATTSSPNFLGLGRLYQKQNLLRRRCGISREF